MDTHTSAAAEWRRFGFLPLAAALGYATSVLHVYSLGAFIGPLQQEFGWSRAQTSAGLTVSALISAIGCIPVGMLVDRIGPRRVGLIGVVAMCAALACLSTATGTPANWLALWGVLAVGTFFVQATVWTSAVASRFEASRGLAFAITLSGASLAATVYPILATWLIGNYGWRSAYVSMGGLWGVLVFPVLFLLFRGAHDRGRKEQAAAPAALTGITLSEGLRSAALYKLLMAAALFSFTVIGVAVHFVPILTDSGATPLSAAGIASLVGIFSIVGRLGTGFLLDKYPGHLVGAAAFLIPIAACVLLLTDGANPVSQAVAAAIFGLTLGSEVDVIAYLAAKHFGLKNFGALYGVLQMALAAGTAFGPLAAGAVFDRYQSYSMFLMLTAVLMAASAIALFTLGPARQTAAALSSPAPDYSPP
ncbi:MFS transporter [Steroidobacter agaridevorans]|uniref:MFS transporter n=1 Tax=Steroidobacter agaridevorans TaxID=2695856 RepID=A0A829YB39_9GAMM|nr:MFS transporter [Steroidobacter agaridevorans]GFE79842.1 MFS transporter [Steroidobacter agaridevorans]GFE90190.1 MFS transporter [Steroidobacter agaridevorans]